MIERVPAPKGHGVLSVEPDADSAPYWAGLAEGRLTLPRCLSCGRTWSPPAPRCPRCGRDEREWVPLDGRGSVYSWVVVRRAMDDAFAADVPYTIAVVELDGADGARLVGRVLPGSEQQVWPGLAVRTVAYEVAGRALPGFVTDDGAAAPGGTGTREGKPA